MVTGTRVLARLPGGALADRWHRRTLMLGCDAARAVLACVLGVTVATGRASLALIMAAAAATAALSVLFFPAEVAALPHLVRPAQLGQALAGNEARSYAADLVGSPLGGLLYGPGQAVPFAVDAASYLLSFAAVAAIRRPLGAAGLGTPRRSLAGDITEGLAHVARTPLLRALALTLASANAAMVGALFTLIVVLRQAGVPPATIGAAQGVIAVGGLLGALVAPRVQGRLTFHQLVVGAVGALLALVATATAVTGHLAMVAPLAGALVLAPALSAAAMTQLVTATPDPLRARTVSALLLGTSTPAALAPLATGALITHLGGTAAMTACTATVAVSLATAITSRGLRT